MRLRTAFAALAATALSLGLGTPARAQDAKFEIGVLDANGEGDPKTVGGGAGTTLPVSISIGSAKLY